MYQFVIITKDNQKFSSTSEDDKSEERKEGWATAQEAQTVATQLAHAKGFKEGEYGVFVYPNDMVDIQFITQK